MAKGKKKKPNLKKGGKKKGKGGKKKPAKGKKKAPPPKTELEIKITELMMKRIYKKPRPLKVLLEIHRKWLESYDKMGLPRPIYVYQRRVPPPLPSTEKEVRGTEREVSDVHLMRSATLVEKRKGPEDDSPINVDTAIVKKCDYLKLTFEGLFDPCRKTVIMNTGVHVLGWLGGDVLISNGPLFGKYRLSNFHFHWGETHEDGSEHTLNGRKFTMEMHMVFLPYSDNVDKSGTFHKVAEKAVVGLMFKLSQKPSYYDLFSVIPHISKNGKKLETTNNLLQDFKEVLLTSEYFNYSGSATDQEPGDYEWMLFRKVLPISRSQMMNMWDLRKSDPIKSNVKPVQPLGERTIFAPNHFDHMKCRGKEICECYGLSKTSKPLMNLKFNPIRQ